MATVNIKKYQNYNDYKEKLVLIDKDDQKINYYNWFKDINEPNIIYHLTGRILIQNKISTIPDNTSISEEYLIENFMEKKITDKFDAIIKANGLSNAMNEYYYSERIYYEFIKFKLSKPIGGVVLSHFSATDDPDTAKKFFEALSGLTAKQIKYVIADNNFSLDYKENNFKNQEINSLIRDFCIIEKNGTVFKRHVEDPTAFNLINISENFVTRTASVFNHDNQNSEEFFQISDNPVTFCFSRDDKSFYVQCDITANYSIDILEKHNRSGFFTGKTSKIEGIDPKFKHINQLDFDSLLDEAASLYTDTASNKVVYFAKTDFDESLFRYYAIRMKGMITTLNKYCDELNEIIKLFTKRKTLPFDILKDVSFHEYTVKIDKKAIEQWKKITSKEGVTLDHEFYDTVCEIKFGFNEFLKIFLHYMNTVSLLHIVSTGDGGYMPYYVSIGTGNESKVKLSSYLAAVIVSNKCFDNIIIVPNIKMTSVEILIALVSLHKSVFEESTVITNDSIKKMYGEKTAEEKLLLFYNAFSEIYNKTRSYTNCLFDFIARYFLRIFSIEKTHHIIPRTSIDFQDNIKSFITRPIKNIVKPPEIRPVGEEEKEEKEEKEEETNPIETATKTVTKSTATTTRTKNVLTQNETVKKGLSDFARPGPENFMQECARIIMEVYKLEKNQKTELCKFLKTGKQGEGNNMDVIMNIIYKNYGHEQSKVPKLKENEFKNFLQNNLNNSIAYSNIMY